MPAADAAALLRRNADDPTARDRPAVRVRRPGVDARRVRRRVPPVREPVPRAAARRRGRVHVGVLLDNTPDYLFALGGAALVGRGGRRAQPHAPRRAPPARRAAHRLRRS